MTRPKYTKPDKNQTEIVEQLRELGFDVDIVCDLPGIFDLVVSGERKILWCGEHVASVVCSVRVEVKSEGGLLSDGEIEYYQNQIHKESYIVAYSAKDVLRWFDGIAPQ